jgi:CPA2 family monovalent cation:H+ antiporter-2
LRDAFAVLFFVSVGMLFDPMTLLRNPLPVIATVLIVVLGKSVAAFLIVIAFRHPVATALTISASLAQIGEFSFILAALGRTLGLLEDEAMQAIVSVSIVSIVLNPVLYRAIQRVEGWVSQRPGLHRLLDGWRHARETDAVGIGPGELDPPHRAIVVGYGPIGRTVTRLLRENGVAPTVIELNIDTVRQLREEGIGAVYGDAAQADTLRAAGVERASSLILSADIDNSREIIRIARETRPDIRVLARTAYIGQRHDLERAGADVVCSGEGEVALALTEAILARLGATPDQMDRERSRVRAELFG